MIHTCPGCGKRRRVKAGAPIVCECYCPGTKEHAVRIRRETRRESIGVSVEFFTGACKLLDRIHGPRMCGSVVDEFRASLADAEMLFKSLPKVAKKAGASS